MIQSLSQPVVQEFLFTHESEDEKKLILKHREILGVPASAIANQLVCRRKARQKLPTWYGLKGVVYPPSLNLEQSSSEATARFKQNLIKSLSVKTLADLTGGFGIDSYFFSKQASVEFVEPNGELLEFAKHSHQLLGASIQYHQATAEDFIKGTGQTFDLIFLDPSRRSKSQQKVFRLADCEPDVAHLRAALFGRSPLLLLKASPLLDIQQGIRELESVRTVFIVSVENECKELLFFCDVNFTGEPAIHCVNLRSSVTVGRDYRLHEDFSFLISEETKSKISYSTPLRYIFEPNVSILKGGGFKCIASRFGLFKLHPNTHVYTADQMVEGFPGRTFQVLEPVRPDKKLVEKFAGGYANILVRNYPMSVEEIKKKTGLKEGGELFLIGCRDEQQKQLLMARRLR